MQCSNFTDASHHHTNKFVYLFQLINSYIIIITKRYIFVRFSLGSEYAMDMNNMQWRVHSTLVSWGVNPLLGKFPDLPLILSSPLTLGKHSSFYFIHRLELWDHILCAFLDWFLSVCVMDLSSINIVACFDRLFLFSSEKYLLFWISPFIYSSFEGCFGCS